MAGVLVVIVLDTHTVIWWTLDPTKLSKRAAKLCSEFNKTPAYLSSISIWEIGIKIKKGKLDLGISAANFTDRLKRTGLVHIVPVDETIWLRNLELAWDHRDSSDRTIVATAQIKNVPVLTKDKTIRQFKGVKTIW